jgi:DNA-binding MarR family transcriptional regulator
LIDGSDKACQSLIYNLLTLGLELEACRNVVAEKFDVSGPQYSILMGIARFQGDRGIRASAVADLLNVSAAFITTQTGQLIEKGLLAKERNPADRREVLLKVSASGERMIDQFSTLISDMNDTLFGELSPGEFRVLVRLIEKMVGASSRTLEFLYAKS